MGLRAALPAFAEQLSKFTSSRLKNLKASSPTLPDVPHEPFPDRAVLFDAPWLTTKGRSSADQYHRTGAYDVFENEGSLFFAMPRTLARFDRATDEWIFTEDTSLPPLQKLLPGWLSYAMHPTLKPCKRLSQTWV